MPLANQDASVMDGFSMSQLEHESLQATFQEVRRLQGQDVIQTLLGLIQETIAVHTLQKRIALENTTRIALLEREQRPCSIPDLRQLHLHTPELTLVTESILTNQLQLCIQALLLIRTAGLLESFTICRTANAAQRLPKQTSLLTAYFKALYLRKMKRTVAVICDVGHGDLAAAPLKRTNAMPCYVSPERDVSLVCTNFDPLDGVLGSAEQRLCLLNSSEGGQRRRMSYRGFPGALDLLYCLFDSIL